jgi:uncharacterized protein (DUF2384 family)
MVGLAKDDPAIRGARAGLSNKGAQAVSMTVLSPSSLGFVAHFVDKGGIVDVDRVADFFRMTKGQLAETIGLGAATIGKFDRKIAPRTQSRVREMLEIIARVRSWAGGETQAMAWYRSQPIPALDGRTPEVLVKAGHAGAVRDYLDHLALGGFA